MRARFPRSETRVILIFERGASGVIPEAVAVAEVTRTSRRSQVFTGTEMYLSSPTYPFLYFVSQTGNGAPGQYSRLQAFPIAAIHT